MEPRFDLKREDQIHVGAHKINNAWASSSNVWAKEIIAETGAGQSVNRNCCSPFQHGMYYL